MKFQFWPSTVAKTCHNIILQDANLFDKSEFVTICATECQFIEVRLQYASKNHIRRVE